MDESNGNQPQQTNGLAVASMVLGIISLVLFCVWYISAPCAILAIIFSLTSKKNGKSGMATAGLILGIVALCVMTVAIIYAAVCYQSVISSLKF